MPKFAHIETGKVLEPQPAPDESSYLRFVAGGRDTSGWKIVGDIPDDIVHGATVDGPGSYSNPPVVTAPALAAADLDRGMFLRVAMATDAAKFNAILLALPLVGLSLDEYRNAKGIHYADALLPGTMVTNLFAFAKGANLLDDPTITSFLQNWVTMYPG